MSTDEKAVDAYVKECEKIMKRQIALDDDFRRLRALVEEKSPHLFVDSTDFYWSGAESAEKFADYLRASRVSG